jgi:hypothetical protein
MKCFHLRSIRRALQSGLLVAGAGVATLAPLNTYSAQQEMVGTITRLYAYTQVTNVLGDVVVEFSNPPAQCAQGFWIRGADAGSKNAYALLLSAYHTQAAVRIVGEDTQMWPGSQTAICRVLVVALD